MSWVRCCAVSECDQQGWRTLVMGERESFECLTTREKHRSQERERSPLEISPMISTTNWVCTWLTDWMTDWMSWKVQSDEIFVYWPRSMRLHGQLPGQWRKSPELLWLFWTGTSRKHTIYSSLGWCVFDGSSIQLWNKNIMNIFKHWYYWER